MNTMDVLTTAVKKGDLKTIQEILETDSISKRNWFDYNLLNLATESSQWNIAKLLINHGSRVNKTTKRYIGNTPLHYAVKMKKLELIKMLVAHEASMNVRNEDGETPIHNIAGDIPDNYIGTYLMSIHIEKDCSNLANNDGLTYFHVACICGSFNAVEKFLKNGADVNSSVDSGPTKGYTPLHFAAKSRQLKVIELLLEHGANVNAKNADGFSPLHLAFQASYKGPCFKLLVSKLTNIRSQNVADNDGMSHFFIACTTNNTHAIGQLIKGGAEINSFDPINHCSPLHFAAENGCTMAVTLLLDAGADFCMKNKKGLTPLHVAFYKFHDRVVDLILKKHHTKFDNPSDNDELSHFHIACSRNNPKIVEGFLNSGTSCNALIQTKLINLSALIPLHIAVESQQVKVMKILLKYKANINIRNVEGLTALHLACRGSQIELKKVETKFYSLLINKEKPKDVVTRLFQSSKQVEIVDLLLKNKCDVNAKSYSGKTPLFEACDTNNDTVVLQMKILDSLIYQPKAEIKEAIISSLNARRKNIINLLLKYNADVNINDRRQQTILHRLIKMKRQFMDNTIEVAELFINKGANVNARNFKGETPLYHASSLSYKGLIDIYLKHNADVNLPEATYLTTPLHAVILSYITKRENLVYHLKIIDALVKRGADVNLKMRSGLTALHLAISMSKEGKGPKSFKLPRTGNQLAKQILSYNCDIDAQNNVGMTPLHYACLMQDIDIVSALLDLGANINIEDDNEQTPLTLCLPEIENPDNIISCFLKNYMKKLYKIGFAFSLNNTSCYAILQKFKQKEFSRFQNLFKSMKCYNLKSEECISELEKMKNLNIDNYTTLYSILFKTANKMTLHIKNDLLKKLLEQEHFDKKFPLYGYLVKLQFKKGLAREVLINPAKDSLNYLTGVDLPYSCSHVIFEYLSDNNLKDLITAKTVILPIKANLPSTVKDSGRPIRKRRRLK